MDSARTRLMDHGAIALAAMLWGSVGIFVRWVDLPGREAVIVFWREIFGCAALLLFLAATRRLRLLKVPSARWLLLLNGVVLAVHWFLLFKAYDLLPVSNAVFLVYTAPLFVAMLAPALLKERLEPRTVVALAIGLGGMALISLSGSSTDARATSWAGIFYALLAALLFALLMIMVKKLRLQLPAMTMSFYGMAIGAVVLLPFALLQDYHVTARGWGSLAVLGVVLVAFTGTIYLHGARGVKAQHLGILAYLEPVSATVLAAIFLAERPTWGDVAGGALIIAAGLLIVLTVGRGCPAEAPVLAPDGETEADTFSPHTS
ncbi:MAG: DMT family transporter [Candidatus Geothermincolia bacterium]